MIVYSALAALDAGFRRGRCRLRVCRFRRLIGRREHFALEDPDLDADDAVVGARFGQTVIDVRAERVQRNATFAVLLGAGDFRAVQAAGDANLDAQRADAHRVGHRALHGATEHDATLELLRDAFGNQQCIQLGLADFGDVDAHVAGRHLHHLRDLATQLLDVLALLADDDARTRGVNGDIHFARGALDHDSANRRFGQLFLQQLAHQEVGVHVRNKVLARRVPRRITLARDAEADTN